MARKIKTNDAPIEPITLADLSDRYLKHMQEAGKSLGTCFSYAMELKTAQAELGADTLIDTIKPEQIGAFETCDRVMKLRSGKPKAEPSFMKTRRVPRLAFAWAVEAKLLATSPYASALTVPQADAEKIADEVEPTLVRTPDLTVVVGDTLVTDGTPASEAKRRGRKSPKAITSEPTAA